MASWGWLHASLGSAGSQLIRSLMRWNAMPPPRIHSSRARQTSWTPAISGWWPPAPGCNVCLVWWDLFRSETRALCPQVPYKNKGGCAARRCSRLQLAATCGRTPCPRPGAIPPSAYAAFVVSQACCREHTRACAPKTGTPLGIQSSRLAGSPMRTHSKVNACACACTHTPCEAPRP